MKTTLICNKHYRLGEIDDRLYGSFVEHMGRVVYSGIYEPGHPDADSDGFREDVLQAARDMGITCVRYPGGNFVSNYDWLDGVGPKEMRPRKLDIAWKSIETNEFGTDEFMRWINKAGAQPIMTVNLGTKGVENALSLLEYCNLSGGIKYSDLRRLYGASDPYDIKLWCLGNEMDGKWQIGHKTADEYGRLAAETGKAMKLVDPEIKLIACGSAKSDMSTHPDWDMRVLEYVYDIVDFISVHQYYAGQDKGTEAFLAQSLDMERYIETIRSAISVTKQKLHSQKQMLISIDEWGVWAAPPETVDEQVNSLPWQIAPPISEQIYTLEDALLFSSMMMTMLRNADIIKLACQSLLTNISACIMTERGGEMWKQPIYYPFQYIAAYGHGSVLRTRQYSPAYGCDEFSEVPYLDSVAVLNENAGELVVFSVNRSAAEAADFECVLQDIEPAELIEFITLSAENPKQTNHINHNAVIPKHGNSAKINGNVCRAVFPPLSFNMLRLSCRTGGGSKRI